MVNVNRKVVDAPNIENEHRTPEILEALGAVFYNKCYICEKKQVDASLFEVDHFITQSEDEDLKYVWSNLYLCCKECNSTRKKRTPTGGYLDPCDDNDDVEVEIVYELPPYDFNNPTFAHRDAEPSQKVINTIEQIRRAHYGNEKTKAKCAALREVIKSEATKLMALMLQEKNAVRDGNDILSQSLAMQIDRYLDNSSAFTMLLRTVAEKYR